MTTDADPPEAAPEAPPDGLGSLDPGELVARALHTPRPTPGQGSWVPPAPEELAQLLPQYSIQRLLGHGGMGAVYQGEQPALQRKVALKLLPAELARDAQFVARFLREARLLARLQHPGIVAVHDCGQSSAGHLYFVMEYVEGTDLRQVLRSARLQPDQALELTMQICDALHYAHRQGVIHRDIKPANILVGVDGRVKVADFGLARPHEPEEDNLTQTNMVMGTPAYMAPEQRMGHADQRADIFALGVMLYEMLTGQRPHGAFDPPSQKVQVDVRIDRVVLKALQSEPERRYQHVSELRGDVEHIRTTPLPTKPRVVAAPPRPAAPRQATPLPARRRAPAPPAESPWPLAMGVGLLVTLLFVGAWAFLPPAKAPSVPPKPATPVALASGGKPKPPPFFSELPATRPRATPKAVVKRPDKPATPALAVSTPLPATPLPAPPLPTATAAPWPAPGNKMSDVSGMVHLADLQFARGLNDFPQVNDERWKLGLVNGEFQMILRQPHLWWFAHPLQSLHVKDFVCEVRARVMVNKECGWGLGVINGNGDFRSWSGVAIDGAGRFNSHTYDARGLDLPWVSSPAMRKGVEANTVRIEVIGQRMRVFANGVFVFERSHPLPADAVLTLFAYNNDPPPVEVRVSTVQVWVPRAVPAAAAPLGANK